ncbi:MAG TPA: phosphate ABC transporter ATP-binding protein, partial [Bacteroidetes bacterium]|nr:phosphate ABC transporter ATP-binding protein [Bacteroidota bacterium]
MSLIEANKVNAYYGKNHVLKDIQMEIKAHTVTAFIGPSGCGKSTFLRMLNRMNDYIDTFHMKGEILIEGKDIYKKKVKVEELRQQVGMVFQKPNPFPKSIRENVAWGARINGYRGDLGELVEDALTQAALWAEVKDKLDESGLTLSGGQQQRLCIARAIAIKPEILLMDEPTSALDPLATLRIEELLQDLKEKYTIIIVTHNMQ